jgi:3-hydroxyisobutyrate dehydrogenase
MARVGFIGLGIMGGPMAGHLLTVGHDLTVHNRTAAKCGPLRGRGANVAATPREAAAGAEFLFLCVSDTPDVEAVLFGPAGAAKGLGEGTVVIDCSTISAEATEGFAGRLARQDVALLDAPLTGGDVGAKSATLTVMVGGEKAAFERALPLLQTVGKLIVHMGPSGAGQRTKMVNQIICALNVLGMAEGLAFAEQCGMDLGKVLRIVSSGAAGSWALTNYAPRILEGDFNPGFPMHLQSKDLRLCTEAIEKLGGRFEGTALTNRLFREATESGLARDGTQSLINLLRRSE